MSRIHVQSAIRYMHDEKKDVLYPVERHRHMAYDLSGGPCPMCGQSMCFPTQPLQVHVERMEAAISS